MHLDDPKDEPILNQCPCRVFGPPPLDPPAPRHDHGVAYWGTFGLVYVVGGLDATTSAPLHDLWAYRLADQLWTPLTIAATGAPERVRAAAFDYVHPSLLVIDETVERGHRGDPERRDVDGDHHERHCEPGQHRLLRLSVADGLSTVTTHVLACWDGEEHDGAFAMAVAPDGSVYVAASDRAQRYAVARLRIDTAGAVSVIGALRERLGVLASGQAVATDAGLSLLVRLPDGLLNPEGVRPADLSVVRDRELGDLF